MIDYKDKYKLKYVNFKIFNSSIIKLIFKLIYNFF